MKFIADFHIHSKYSRATDATGSGNSKGGDSAFYKNSWVNADCVHSPVDGM
jgi:hypothetical protein